MTRPDYSRTPVWTDAQVPRDFVGSYHIGGGVFRQRCRACDEVHDTQPGQGMVMRHAGIGPHEVAVHGLKVAGLNAGLLS